jgi:endonuclease/exonuclease/phosphatase family metal-dependent hydrolase
VSSARNVKRIELAPQVFSGGSWGAARGAHEAARGELQLITWNVWFGSHMYEERRDALFAELARRDADVVALQEVTHELYDELLLEPWLRADYHVSPRPLYGYDVAILSRRPVRRMVEIALPTAMGRRLLVAELASGLAVATVHLESTAEESAARAAQLRIIQPALAASYPDAILVGDMNFTPSAPVETAALDPSFVDAWAALHPDQPGYTVDTDLNTMRFDVQSKPSHKRIDRMFVRSARWQARSIELIGTRPIDEIGTFTSDHFGLAAVFAAR